MFYSRAPCSRLQPFVKTLWVSDQLHGNTGSSQREHVLPTGHMHLVFRLSEFPLRVFNGTANTLTVFGHAVVGGPRAEFYSKEVGQPTVTVGVQFYPGIAEALFDARTDELANRHTSLGQLWGYDAELTREQLLAAETPERQLQQLENILNARLPNLPGLHPAVASAMKTFKSSHTVAQAVALSGYSHRYFSAVFEQATGLKPKTYCRVGRLQKLLLLSKTLSLPEAALAAGYCDQAHFTREFREFSGVTPDTYRKLAPEFSHHLTPD